MIHILMATYNGGLFLEEQLRSLFENQIEQNFRITISDDHSIDNSWEILCQWQKRYPERIEIVRHTSLKGGAAENFLSLMSTHTDDYVMLCDQDDVWLPHKIKWALQGITKMEARFGKGIPCLFHTDLQVVDEHLKLIDASFSQRIGMTRIDSLKSALTQNDVTGCTVIYNRALSEKISGKIPAQCVMHDWWLALVAHAFGQKEYSTVTPILYRQHEKNVFGAKKAHGLSYWGQKLKFVKNIQLALWEMYAQAESFLSIYGAELSFEQREMLSAFSSLPQLSKGKRIWTMKKWRFFRPGWKRKLSQMVWG